MKGYDYVNDTEVDGCTHHLDTCGVVPCSEGSGQAIITACSDEGGYVQIGNCTSNLHIPNKDEFRGKFTDDSCLRGRVGNEYHIY